MSIYYLVRYEYDGRFTVTKWEEGSIYPLQEYRVTLDKGRKPTCSCPSGHNRGYCKHPNMVKEWVRQGMTEFQQLTA